MIVRIATEDQYEVSADDIPKLNELDNLAVASCDANDDGAFRDAFGRLLEYV
ncbi:MAG: PspA-associated protein PspAA, partial [Solirubrobacteraceae bacterium]